MYQCSDVWKKKQPPTLILTILAGQMGGLSEESETCLRQLLESSDLARVVAGNQDGR